MPEFPERTLRGPLKVELGFTHTFEAEMPLSVVWSFFSLVSLLFMLLPQATGSNRPLAAPPTNPSHCLI